MMTKLKLSISNKCTRTPSKSNKLVRRAPVSPAQKEAKRVTLKYKRGYRKSPGKVGRIVEALADVESGNSIRKTAQKFGFSESFLRRRAIGEVSLDSRNGPNPVFSSTEEIEMAKWLSEMSKRGMGLGPAEFLDFVQGIITKEKRKTNFVNNRPSYTWYYSFMARNCHLVEKRQESSLENSRAKVTTEQLDKWFAGYYQFLSQLHLLDKPHRVYNADESGFSMGSKASVVIGPTKKEYPDKLPHLCGQTKKRLTGMFCANAEGEVIPPFLIYALPKPTAYDPLIGSRKGTVIEYTEKGWMNGKTFLKFLQHFDQHASKERPVILLIDSVSSHIDLDIFMFAKNHEIELYRLIPNATHFLQPLDNGVFGPLKKVWYKLVKKYTKENPGKSIGKENFASKLHEAFMQFYKPLTIVSSFRSTGIFPIDRSKISDNKLKPALTFQPDAVTSVSHSYQCCEDMSTTCSSVEDRSAQSTSSSCNDLLPVQPSSQPSNCSLSGLALLADIACTDTNNNVVGDKSISPYVSSAPLCPSVESSDNLYSPCENTSCNSDGNVSVHLKQALVFPSCSEETIRSKRKSTSDTIPDCLTSSESIRSAALKKLEAIKRFARKEQQAKNKFNKEKCKQASKEKKARSNVCKKKTAKTTQKNDSTSEINNQSLSKTAPKRKRFAKKCLVFDAISDHCVVCKQMTEDELGWIQCDLCDHWFHVSCIPKEHEYDKNALIEENTDFYCHICVT